MKHFLAKAGIIFTFLIYAGQALHAMNDKKTPFENSYLILQQKREKLTQFHEKLKTEINELQKTNSPKHIQNIFKLLATKKRIGLRPYHKLYGYELRLFQKDNRKMNNAAETIEELRKKNENLKEENENLEELKKVEERFSALFEVIKKEQDDFSKECNQRAKGIAYEHRPPKN